MKSIVLHGPAVDNAGQYRDAGEELAIGEQGKAGYIAAAAARDMVERGGAVSATAAAREERAVLRDAAPAGAAAAQDERSKG